MAMKGLLCIPQSSNITGTGGLLFGRDAVSVFYNPNQLGWFLGGLYPPAEMQSVYSTAPTNWADSWVGCTPLQRCSQCILQPQPTGLILGWVVPPCRDAVSVFYSPNQLGWFLGGLYPPAEMQSVYSTAPTNWADSWVGCTPLQRCSQCILQPQPTGLILGWVVPHCRDAVSVFYSPNQLVYYKGLTC